MYGRIEDEPEVFIDTMVCLGDIIEIGDQIFTQSGRATINQFNDLCDTIVNVNITQIPPISYIVTASATTVNCIDTVVTITIEPVGSIDPSFITYDWTTIGGNIIGRTDSTIVAFGCGPDTMRLDGTASAMEGRIFINWTTIGGTIVSDSTTYTPLIRGPGTYFINVVDDCSAMDTVVITIDNTEPDITLEDSLAFDCSQSEFTLNATGSTVGERYIYRWTATNGGALVPPTDTLLVNVTATGKYYFEVIDTFNQCTAIDSIVVFGETDPPLIDGGLDRIITCDSTLFTLNGRYSDGGANPTVVWSTIGGNITAVLNDSTITVDATGRYVFSVLNTETLCSSTDTIRVTQNTTLPNAAAGPDREIDCVTTFFDLDGTSSDMGANFTANWTTIGGNIVSGANTYTPRVDAAGFYIINIRNTTNGCIGRDTLEISADSGVPQITLADTLAFDCSQPQFTLDATGSSAGAQFIYAWTATNGGTLVPPTNGLTVLVTTPGRYFFRVTNRDNNCTKLDSIEVTGAFDPPILSTSPDLELSCDSTEYTLNGSFSNGGNAPTESWRTVGGNISSVINPSQIVINAPGLYIYTVVNAETSCEASDTVRVTQNINLPTADAGPDRTLDCDSLSVRLDGSGSSSGAGFTFSWTTDVGSIISGATTRSPRVNGSGKYFITVRNNANGCSSIDSASVSTSADFPNVSILTPDTINCVNNEITIDASGSSSGADFNAQWTTAGGNIVSGNTSLTPRVNRAGSYTLTVTNTSSGCSNSATVSVVEFIDQPSADAGSTDEITCIDTELTLDGSASTSGSNIRYAWTAAPGNIVSGATTVSPMINQAGTYTITVTDSRSLCTSTAQVIISENTAQPSAVAGDGGVLDCVTTELSLDGSASDAGPNISYLWSTNDGNILSGGTTTSPRINGTGTYVLTVTDTDNGCTSSSSVLVTESGDRPTASAGNPATIDCNNATIQLNGNGSSMGVSFSYQWTTNDGTIDDGATTLTPTVSAAGTYTLTVTDNDNGCTAISSVLVDTDFASPRVEIALPDQITCTSRLVVIDGSNSEAGVDIQFQWTSVDGNIVSGGSTNQATVDQIGTYRLTVTNSSNGCSDFLEINVTQDASIPLSSITLPDSITCRDLTVTLDGSASSSGANYQYQWSTSGGTLSGDTNLPTVTATSTGSYTLTVTDDDTGCTSQDVVMVGENTTRPSVSAGSDFDIFCGQQNVTVEGTVINSTGSVAARWSTIDGEIVGSNQGLIVNISREGTYTLEIEDSSNGCTATDQVNVTLIDLLLADLDITQPDCENQLPVIDIAPTSMIALGTSLSFSLSLKQLTLSLFRMPWVVLNVIRLLSGELIP